ncbi:MAG: polysaccharide pyruvyl transferase family protein [Gemmatimonadales bacterium]|nr:MAG: polysaccharide pyruvyl transferase family protein [Gemmatimonadales bacterium]
MRADRQKGPESHAPTVEILGPWLHNKGDELMLCAVVEQLGETCTLGTSTLMGLDHVPMQPLLRRIWWRPSLADLAKAAQEKSLRVAASEARLATELTFRSRESLLDAGMIRGSDVSALLDCSGFAYGDTWTTPRMRARTTYYRQLRQQGAVLVMLPQALGPFEDPEIRECARALLGLFDLVYARDADSLAHLASLEVETVEIGRAPDITHLLEGTPPTRPGAWRDRVCVVPNARLLDRTPPEVSRRYVDFVVRSIAAVHTAELEPWIVLHESNDRDLVREILARLDAPVPVLDEDAAVTKGVLGASHAAIGSRYHALVGALSQGVPSIGTSWSHKYDQLFSEYGCPELGFSLQEAEHEVDRAVRSILEPRRRAELHRRISAAAARQKVEVRDMWDRVEAVLGVEARHPAPSDSEAQNWTRSCV